MAGGRTGRHSPALRRKLTSRPAPAATSFAPATSEPRLYLEHLHLPAGTGRLHVERLGRGDRAVVLLHGFGTSASLWRPLLRPLAQAGRVALAIDLLGYGESDRPLDAAYDLPAQADALERVLTGLRCRDVVVVGQDVGALVALALAARYPARVQRLVLVNPPDPSDLPPSYVRAMQRAATRSALSGVGQQVAAAALLEPLLDEATAGPGPLPPAAQARYLAPWVGAEGVEQLQRLARTLELESVPLDAFASIETPTLVLRGTADRSVSPAVSPALAGTLPNGVLALMAGVGRLAAIDDPDGLVARVLAWSDGSALEPMDA